MSFPLAAIQICLCSLAFAHSRLSTKNIRIILRCIFTSLSCVTGISGSPGSYFSNNARFSSSNFSSTSSTSSGNFSLSSKVARRVSASGVVGAVVKPPVARRGLSYGIVGFEKTGVGEFGVSRVLVVDALESGAERAGETAVNGVMDIERVCEWERGCCGEAGCAIDCERVRDLFRTRLGACASRSGERVKKRIFRV